MMRVTIVILALLVMMGWAIVYFKYNEGGFFHLTLAVAVAALVTQWLQGNKSAHKFKDRNHESRKRSLKER